MKRRSVTYHGVRLRKEPMSFECPYCLHPVGLFGNLLLKVFGRAAHGCPRTNVLTADEVMAEEFPAEGGVGRSRDG